MLKLFKWPLTWLVICICLSVIVLAFGVTRYFPEEAAASQYNDNADQATTIGNQMPQAKQRLKNAITLINGMASSWTTSLLQHSPGTSLASGGINIGENPFQLVVDAPKFRNDVQRQVNHQMKSGGVKVLVGPYVTDPPQESDSILATYFNYPAIPFPVVIFNLGQVQVQGTWDQIMKNYQSWGHMPNFFAVSDGLQIAGTAPYLTGTYSVSVVGYIRGKTLFPTVPTLAVQSSTGGAGGGAAAGGGGPRAGGPGMPGGAVGSNGTTAGKRAGGPRVSGMAKG